MNDDFLKKIKEYVENEPYTKFLNIKVVSLKPGDSVVEMKIKKEYENFFSITHGGAVFSLADVALGSAANASGNIAVALNISINYIKPSRAGDTLRAHAKEISGKVTIALYEITVENQNRELIAKAYATTFKKKQKIPLS